MSFQIANAEALRRSGARAARNFMVLVCFATLLFCLYRYVEFAK